MIKTTGIGSLPHRSIQAAVDYSLKHDIPFLPQMAIFKENMIEQATYASKIIDNHHALEFFTEQLLEQQRSQFKIQIAGPETLKGTDQTVLNTCEKFLSYFEKFNLRPMIFIDEPVMIHDTQNLNSIFFHLKKMNIITGLHSCNSVDQNKILQIKNLDYFSYDSNLSPVLELQNTKKCIGIDFNSRLQINETDCLISYTCGFYNFSEEFCEKFLIFLNDVKNNKGSI